MTDENVLGDVVINADTLARLDNAMQAREDERLLETARLQAERPSRHVGELHFPAGPKAPAFKLDFASACALRLRLDEAYRQTIRDQMMISDTRAGLPSGVNLFTGKDSLK